MATPFRNKPKTYFKVALRFSGVNFVSLNFIDYRLIDLENTEIGRCISTGPSPLDLGIGAMA